MSNIRIGTCSWKYDSWKNLVYSGADKNNYLTEYSKKFNTVEIDQWFWSLFGEKKINMPKPDDVIKYNESVPPEFKFSVKVPNSITLTHFYNRSKKEPLKENPHFLSLDLLDDFLTLLEPFGDKLGPLMFQFEYLNKQKMNSQLEFQDKFSAFIQNAPDGFEYSVEIRNPNYLNKSYFEFIAENKLQHVFLQGYYMPPVWETYIKFKNFINGQTILRLHGPDRKGIEEKTGGEWNKIVEPKDEELNRIVDIIRDLLSREVDIYLNVNNHYEGSAPITIDKIYSLLNNV